MGKGRAKAKHNPDFNAEDLVKMYGSGERDFSGLDLEGEAFQGVNLAGVVLDRCNLAGCVFDNVDLSGASFVAADLGTKAEEACTTFDRCNLRSADFSRANLRNADFRTSVVDGAVFHHSDRLWAKFPRPVVDTKPTHNTRKLVQVGPNRWEWVVFDPAQEQEVKNE